LQNRGDDDKVTVSVKDISLSLDVKNVVLEHTRFTTLSKS